MLWELGPPVSAPSPSFLLFVAQQIRDRILVIGKALDCAIHYFCGRSAVQVLHGHFHFRDPIEERGIFNRLRNGFSQSLDDGLRRSRRRSKNTVGVKSFIDLSWQTNLGRRWYV